MVGSLYLMHHAPAPRRSQEIVGAGIDRDLDEYGRNVAVLQSERLEHYLENGTLGTIGRTILTSPLRRALQTAEIMAGRCGFDVEPVPGLTAQHFGVLEGKTMHEVNEKAELRQHMWDQIAPEDRDKHQVPGGESNYDFAQRIIGSIADLRQMVDIPTPLIITHGSVIDTLIGYHSGRRLDEVEGQNRAYEGRALVDTPTAITALGRPGEQYLHIPGASAFVGQQDLDGLRRHVELYAKEYTTSEAERTHLLKLASFITRA